jgi:hypothetical protein
MPDNNDQVLNQDKTLQHANNMLKRMWSFRRQYDTRRSYFYRQYIGSRDQKLFPDGISRRSNTFVMYPFSNVETVVSRTLDALFSNDPWMECRGRGANEDEAAEKMEKVLDYKLRLAHFMAEFEEFIRTCAIYGHAGIKVDWDWDYDMAPQMVPDYMKDQNGQPVMAPVQTPQGVMQQPVQIGQHLEMVQVPRSRPKFTTIDVFDLLVDPDGSAIAHLTERTLPELLRDQENYKQRTGNDLYFPEALAKLKQKLSAEKDVDQIVIRMAELWDAVNNTVTIATFSDDASTSLALKDMRMALRSGATRTGFSRKVFGGEPLLLWSGPNPFMHKRVPIFCTSYVKIPGEIYGIGAIETISDLTESLNCFVNMIVDNWNMNINKRYAYDINADIDHDSLNNLNTPGGKVAVNGDPGKVVMPLPMMTPNAGDYQILDLYRGMIEMASGVSDFYSKGVGSPTNNGTATGISQIINESNFRFKMFIRNLELDVLQPLLECCAAMVQQFMTDQEEVLITQDNPAIPKWQVVRPEELVGSMNFDIVAANYASGKVVRQRNLMALVNLVGQSPYWNQYMGLQEICKVFEIPNAKKLMYTPDQVQQMQAAQQKQQVDMMIFESMLNTESKARLAQAKPQAGGKEGRPATKQFEGKIPGAGLTSSIRDMAQGMGANALGLEGLGQIPHAG